MKNSLLILIVGLICGTVIGMSLKGCGKTDPIEPKIEYIDKIVEVPTDSIVYEEGPVRDTTIWKTKYLDRPIPGTTDTIKDTIYYPVYLSKYNQNFTYNSDSLDLDGTASFIANDYEPGSFKIESLNVTYTEKNITKIKARTFSLYAGGGIRTTKTQFKAVNLGLDLAIKQKTLIGFSIDQPLLKGLDRSYLITVKGSLFK